MVDASPFFLLHLVKPLSVHFPILNKENSKKNTEEKKSTEEASENELTTINYFHTTRVLNKV